MGASTNGTVTGAGLSSIEVSIGADRKGGSDNFVTGCKPSEGDNTGTEVGDDGAFWSVFVGIFVDWITGVGAEFWSI